MSPTQHEQITALPDEEPGKIKYPRRVFLRALARLAGRIILPLFFRISIQGKENFPKGGPLLVVGNHAAVMEAVMMVVYTPWIVELIGGIDVPHDSLTALAVKYYRFIPIKRGSLDRPALRSALSVLEQKGIIGIFPQGGIWQTSEHSAQPGIAWLSEKSQVPVLPIYFGGVAGALGKALRLERPRLTMSVGKLIPAASIPAGTDRKEYINQYSKQVMGAIDGLCPPEERTQQPQIRDERFELQVDVRDGSGAGRELAPEVQMPHAEALCQMLHTPVILDIFLTNLHLPIEPLQQLIAHPKPEELARACTVVLDYLASGNPYLLTYRFGPKRGEEMRLGVQELRAAAQWAADQGYQLHLTPVYRYLDVSSGATVVRTEQQVFNRWR